MTPVHVLVSIGNTRTRFCVAGESELEAGTVLPNTDAAAIARSVAELATRDGGVAVLIASVNAPAADALEKALRAEKIECLRFGRDVPVPLVNTLTDDSTVGVDRLLDALGAFDRAQQACIVIDAGTAVTVDFIDGEGTFHGGAIAPGLSMMLKALHEHTAALPSVEIDAASVPPSQIEYAAEEHAGQTPFGKSTREAMIVGVVAAVRGLCHHLIDRYAEFYRGYPRVIATGGDAPLLFENDSLVEHVVPDLTLIGMHAAAKRLRDLDAQSENDDAAGGS